MVLPRVPSIPVRNGKALSLYAAIFRLTFASTILLPTGSLSTSTKPHQCCSTKKWWSFVKTPQLLILQKLLHSNQSINAVLEHCLQLRFQPSLLPIVGLKSFRGGHRWQKNRLRYFHSCEDESKRKGPFRMKESIC